MRHLNPYKTSPVDFIDKVINSKHQNKDDKRILSNRASLTPNEKIPPSKMTYKERCLEIRKRNKTRINEYEQAFTSDNLSIVATGIPNLLNTLEEDKDDMVSLYSYQSKIMGELRTEVLSSDGYLNDLCPICESLKATTLDHYLPKTDYPLFSVHPLNLIPCCTVCNEHKLNFIFDNNKRRRFWNAYIDINASEQYLFCEISEVKGMPKPEFKIEKGNLSDEYFKIISDTFNQLQLNDNYKESSDREIIKLKDSCCKYYIKNQQDGLDKCLQTIADTLPDTEINNWAIVLDKALIVADVFKQFVTTALEQEYNIKA